MDTQPVIPAMLADKEERMAARRARREARYATKKGDASDALAKKGKGDVKKEESVSEKQIAESKEVIEREIRVGTEKVTAIRVAADEREATRRIKDEDDRQMRRQKQLEEAQLSTKRNAAIAMQWAALYDHDIPQDVQQLLDEQKAKCDQIVASKDALINDMQVEIRVKDDETVKALKQQEKDTIQLVKTMGTQFDSLFNESARQLRAVENAFLQERQTLLDKMNMEIDALLDKRRNMEIQFLEERQKRIESDNQQMEQTRIQEAEDYTSLKIKLETEIQGLQQQLEEMRATYMLNSEQLLFNYRVLKQREQETNNTKAMQKKKLTRLQDVQSGLMAKYHKTDREYRQTNMDLTEEYKRVTEQYKDLQAKLKHFEAGDHKKYRDVWELNQNQARQIVEKLLQADKIVHEQQLNLLWKPPQEDVFSVEKRAAMDFLRDVESEEVGTAEDAEGNAQGDTEEPGTPQLASQQHPHPAPHSAGAQRHLVRKVMDLLSAEAAFLVDERTKEAMKSVPEDQRNLMRVDAILKALGIETEEHVERLIQYFQTSPDSGELIPASKVAGAIRRFVEENQQSLSTQPASAVKSRQVARAPEEKHELYENKYQVEEFWKRVESVIPERTYAMWEALEKALERYNGILHERAKLMDDTMALRNQNEQLKALLNQYLGSKVNQELYVPPTQLVSMQALYPN